MASGIVRALLTAIAALLGGAIGGGAAFFITYIVTTEVMTTGESAIVFTLLSVPVGFVVGAALFGWSAFGLMQSWSRDDQHTPPGKR